MKSALLKVYSDIYIAFGNGHVALLGLIDLGAAFDTVDHNVYY